MEKNLTSSIRESEYLKYTVCNVLIGKAFRRNAFKDYEKKTKTTLVIMLIVPLIVGLQKVIKKAV